MVDARPSKDKLRGIKQKSWKVLSSRTAKNSRNYIRELVDNLVIEPNPDKSLIALSIGDPTNYGNLRTSPEATKAVANAVTSFKSNGYAPCVGHKRPRQALADYLTSDNVRYDYDDIVLCCGCSHALDIAITVLCDPHKNQNLLMPKPGFPLFRTLAEGMGVVVKCYNLLPESGWKIDLDHLENQIDKNTAAIIVNNPSNPCGSVFDEDHLRDVLEIATRYKIPIIADETYDRMVFPNTRFISMAAINLSVPILICGSLSKRFLVPGWRLGWIAVCDPVNAFAAEIRSGLVALTQRIIGSNTLVQAALPEILNTPQSFHDSVINILYVNAKVMYNNIRKIKGLVPTMPSGSMYMMIQILLEEFPLLETSSDFIQRLMEEESVFCLPGECFGIAGFMRIIITLPTELMREACERMESFCSRHTKKSLGL